MLKIVHSGNPDGDLPNVHDYVAAQEDERLHQRRLTIALIIAVPAGVAAAWYIFGVFILNILPT